MLLVQSTGSDEALRLKASNEKLFTDIKEIAGMDNKGNGSADTKKSARASATLPSGSLAKTADSSQPGREPALYDSPCTPRGCAFTSPVENGQLPDPAHWAVSDVVNYFKAAGFDEQACAFQDQEIDGKSLLLMTRNDVLTGLSIKLGPALKMYEYHVKPLQTQHLKKNAW
ncbi:SAM13 protein, partial [Polyodon spathula]|nr:atherin-like isoform X1 [Polyodon spathula]MBN3286604.1 SAM13 protein [Polyodon spathula]